ncbi:MAG: acyl-CoA dehydrogenase [Gammaproteobacteria bacterium]|nr:acyl-CoA dehydrogenase [Gammaproteobacteria bacterium]
MDFSLSDEQQARKQQAIDFARAELNDNLLEREQAGLFSREDWNKCAEYGILGLPVPREYGGTGSDILTSILVLEGLGYGCRDNGLPFALNSQLWSVETVLLKAGSDAQKRRYLPPLCNGEMIGAFGITEEGTGSDAYGMTTHAEKTSDGYILNGKKCYITSAPVADLSIIFATTDPKLGIWGITAFIVERDTPGYAASDTRSKMGMQTTQMGDITLEDCLVPAENLLGSEGSGAQLITRTMEAERGYIFASQLGAMERQLEDAVSYARDRKTGAGQPIGGFQSVSNRIADMKVRLEAARHLLYKVAWLDDMGQPLLMDAAIAKLFLSECFIDSSMDAIRTFGARGYVTEFGIERDLRDGIGGLVYSGTSDIQRNIIASLMGVQGK